MPASSSSSRRSAAARDARELAATPTANPYRATLTDPFYREPVAAPRGGQAASPPRRPDDAGAADPGSAPTGRARPHGQQSAGQQPARRQPVAGPSAGAAPSPLRPGVATAASVLAIALSVLLALMGMTLLLALSLADEIGGDRSFYQGADQAYRVVALFDLGLALACGCGAVGLLMGKLAGRIALTIGGGLVVFLSCYWLMVSEVPWRWLPPVVGVAGLAILALSYQQSVTTWLGVLRAPQPE